MAKISISGAKTQDEQFGKSENERFTTPWTSDIKQFSSRLRQMSLCTLLRQKLSFMIKNVEATSLRTYFLDYYLLLF